MDEFPATELVTFKETKGNTLGFEGLGDVKRLGHRGEEEKGRENQRENEDFTGKIEEKKEKPQESVESIRESKENNIIACCNCKSLMSYPVGSIFVTCPSCKSVNPTADLLTLYCSYCKLVSYFPKGSKIVQCNCGMIYSVT